MATKKTVTKKKAATPKTTTKKTAKKTAATATKRTVKKPVAKKTVKTAVKKTVTKKPAAKKLVAKKVTAKKPVAKKPVVKKQVAAKPASKPAPKKPAGLPEQLLSAALKVLDERQAEEIVTVDLTGRSTMADYVVIASGRASRQIGAIAHYLAQAFAALGVRQTRVEGAGEGNWVLVDAGDIIVHLFRPEVRAYYNLEQLWTRKGHARDTTLPEGDAIDAAPDADADFGADVA